MKHSIYNFNSIFQQIDLSALKHFYAVASFGGFSKAARATGQSQPALSLGLQKLEKSLGMKLINRGSRQPSLTKEGLALLSFCQRMESGLDSLVSSVGSDSLVVRRRLRVGTALSLGFAPLLSGCVDMLRNDDSVELELSTMRTYQLLSDVRDGDLDAALVPDDVYDSGLKFYPVKKDHLIFVVAPSEKAKFKNADWLATVNKMPLITYPRETPMRSFVDKICVQNSIHFRNLVAVNTFDGIVALVKESAGGAFLLRSLVAKDLKLGVLVEAPPGFVLPKSGVALAVRADKQGNQTAKGVLKWLEN